MADFVLVPGGWCGGWVYQEVADGLRGAGHDAHPVTLTGLAERAHLTRACTNLDTHIEDIVGSLESAGITEAVLCGHSYGGMVITGVADRVPERVTTLVYIDAYVPADGESCWSLTTEAFRRAFVRGAGFDGIMVRPPPGADSRTTAHPLASFVQRIRLSGAVDRVRRREYVYLSGWEGSPFGPVYERLRQDPRWRVHRLPVGHDVLTSEPDMLIETLLKCTE